MKRIDYSVWINGKKCTPATEAHYQFDSGPIGNEVHFTLGPTGFHKLEELERSGAFHFARVYSGGQLSGHVFAARIKVARTDENGKLHVECEGL